MLDSETFQGAGGLLQFFDREQFALTLLGNFEELQNLHSPHVPIRGVLRHSQKLVLVGAEKVGERSLVDAVPHRAEELADERGVVGLHLISELIVQKRLLLHVILRFVAAGDAELLTIADAALLADGLVRFRRAHTPLPANVAEPLGLLSARTAHVGLAVSGLAFRVERSHDGMQLPSHFILLALASHLLILEVEYFHQQ